MRATDPIITLTPTEVLLATNVGCRRNIESVLRDREDETQADYGWDNNLEGALAELAVAKHFNLYFDTALGKFGEKDVGEWHVRCTSYEDGCLRIAPKEKTGKYLLAVGRFDTWRLAGWIDAIDGRQEQWLCIKNKKRPFPNYWIPQNELNSLE